MSEPRSARDAALFLQLVLGISQSAMVSLGKLMNPLTRKIEPDLEGARNAIDTLAALESRTRGNLEPDEARVLSQALADLRLNYVDEVKKQRAGAAAESAPASGEAQAAAPGTAQAAEPGAGDEAQE